jgi:hypothetical protein
MEMARGTGRRVNNSWLLFLVLVTFFFQIHFILGVELQPALSRFFVGSSSYKESEDTLAYIDELQGPP